MSARISRPSVLFLRLPAALLLGLVAASAPHAQDAAAESAVGSSTRAWLELQRSNAQAGRSHPVPGEVAAAIWQRHVDSFRLSASVAGSPPPSAVTGGSGRSGNAARGETSGSSGTR